MPMRNNDTRSFSRLTRVPLSSYHYNLASTFVMAVSSYMFAGGYSKKKLLAR